jgi:hypothetical protein
MFRCYAHHCGLTQREANDTEYTLPVTKEDKEYGEGWWPLVDAGRILIHTHYLDDDFLYEIEKDLPRNGYMFLDPQEEEYTWRESLAIIDSADVVVTRYGGVAVMAAAVGTPTVIIPKPEPTVWASPIYSHPNGKHVMLYPSNRCDDYDGTPARRLQPCMKHYGEFRDELCPLGFKGGMDLFHCWRHIEPKDVLQALRGMV